MSLLAVDLFRSGEWIILIAAVITAIGLIWTKAIRPVVHFVDEMRALMARGLAVIERVEQHWPPLADQVEDHETRLATLERSPLVVVNTGGQTDA